MQEVFKSKVPYITYFLIAVNVICFIVPKLLGEYLNVISQFCVNGDLIRSGEYYRLITGIFLHSGIFHLLFNCYALYVIGAQIESFLGKYKYLIIYFFSGIMGGLFSITFGDYSSIGASGAIFGLMGSLVYFGYHYRVYLGNVLKSQIIPLIALNLLLGFMMRDEGIDNFAHIGGLIGGAMITMAVGVKDKTSLFEKVNGWIITAIFTVFIIYIAFVYGVQ